MAVYCKEHWHVISLPWEKAFFSVQLTYQKPDLNQDINSQPHKYLTKDDNAFYQLKQKKVWEGEQEGKTAQKTFLKKNSFVGSSAREVCIKQNVTQESKLH